MRLLMLLLLVAVGLLVHYILPSLIPAHSSPVSLL